MYNLFTYGCFSFFLQILHYNEHGWIMMMRTKIIPKSQWVSETFDIKWA